MPEVPKITRWPDKRRKLTGKAGIWSGPGRGGSGKLLALGDWAYTGCCMRVLAAADLSRGGGRKGRRAIPQKTPDERLLALSENKVSGRWKVSGYLTVGRLVRSVRPECDIGCQLPKRRDSSPVAGEPAYGRSPQASIDPCNLTFSSTLLRANHRDNRHHWRCSAWAA